MSTLVEIRDVSKTYERGKQKVEVLHHVNLDIQKGDFLALMGPSGSGKTTLLNLIGGLDSPSGGSISVGGQRIDKLGGGALAKWRAANVGFIFQFYNLLPMLSAQKNVEVPLLLTALSAAERKRNAAIALQLVGLAEVVGGDEDAHALGHELVHGLPEQASAQRIHAAGGLVQEEDPGAVQGGRGQGHPLPLTPGKLAGFAAAQPWQTHHRQHLFHPL